MHPLSALDLTLLTPSDILRWFKSGISSQQSDEDALDMITANNENVPRLMCRINEFELHWSISREQHQQHNTYPDDQHIDWNKVHIISDTDNETYVGF